MDLFDLAARITLDTSEYQKSVKDAAASSKTAQAAVNRLVSPIERVKNAFDAMKHPVQSAKQGWDNLKTAAQGVVHPIQTFKFKMDEAATTASKQQSVMAGLAKNYDKAKQKVEEATAAYKKEAAESGKTSDRSIELAKALDRAEKEAAEAEKAMSNYANSVKKGGDESEKSESKVKKMASALGKGAETVAKAGGAAMAVAGAAIGKVLFDSVTKYADFEQLRDGTRKIFSNIDYSAIEADANEAYINLNMSASQYLESINRVGAAFKANMGDEKAYEVAKQGMTAIADYASGTGANVAELNEKYAMITRSTSSYQSIADQFSGILPQTSKDFLAQAQAAGLLSTKYEELTQVPVAEYQEAVTAMLEKGVAAAGFAKNAANESMNTLSGSLNMTKAAWENFVTGLSDSEADVSQLVTSLITSAGAVVNNIVPVITQALSGIGQTVTELAPALTKGLAGMISDVLPGAVEAALGLISALADALIENAGAIIDAGFEILNLFVNYLQDPSGLLKLLDASLVIIGTLADNLVQSLPTLIPAIIEIMLTIAEKLMAPDTLLMLVDAAIEILLALADGIINSLDIIISKAPIIVKSLVSAIIQAAPRMLDAAFKLLGKLGEGIRQGLTALVTIGKSIVEGIWRGISSGLGWIKGKIRGWVGNVMSFIKGLFGIHSPSKWAETVIGKNLALGMAVGITSNADEVEDALSGLADGVKSTADITLNRGNIVSGVHTDGGDSIGDTLRIIRQYLPIIADKQIYLDTGVLAGAMVDPIDKKLGNRAQLFARGIA